MTETLVSPTGSRAPGSLHAERFRIICELGQGGMGKVFLAHDEKLDRDVALKFVGDALKGEERTQGRFLREARAAAALDHPFICKVYDTGEADGDIFIAMEFVEGGNLRQRTREARLPFDDVLKVISETAEALEKAHERGIIHRDLKPENIMLTPQGHVKVMDFGIAKITRAGGQVSQRTVTEDSVSIDGRIVGTIAYMSPEQARGASVDKRSDIFSLGVIFYELLTGRAPFARQTSAETISAILKDPPLRARSIPKEFNAEVNRILEKSLAKDPAARYASARELISDIESLQKERVAVFRPLFKKLSVILPLAASSILILAAVVWFTWLRGRGTANKIIEPVSILIADFQNDTGDPVFGGTTEEALSIGLEGAPFINIYKRSNAKRLLAEIDPGGGAVLDLEKAQLVARREMIKVVIGGRLERRGAGYAISARGIDAVSSKSLSECATTFESKARVLGAIDRIAFRIRSDLGDVPGEKSKEHLIENFTTNSIEAMRFYLDAQGLQSRADDAGAISAYLRAIEKDPDFGRAYSGLALSYYYSGQGDKYAESMQKALSLLDRMSDREKFRTRGVDFLLSRNYQKAVDEFRMLTEQYPADDIGQANLAMAYWGIGDFQQALKSAQVSVALRPRSEIGLRNLAQYALDCGDYKLAEESAQKAIEINPDYEEPLKYLAQSQVATGRFEQAERTWQRYVKDRSMGNHGLLSLALYEGRLNTAVMLIKDMIGNYLALKQPYASSMVAHARVQLADVLSRQKRTASAVRELDQAITDLGDADLYPAARIYLQARENRKAASLALRMGGSQDPLIRGSSKMITAGLKSDLGDTKGAESDLAELIELLENEKKNTDTWGTRYLLANAYLKRGALAEAHSEFEVCLKRAGEKYDIWGDSNELPMAYFYLAEVQEKLGSSAAAASYRKFLDIKRRSDGDETVEEAIRRLSLLERKLLP